MPKGVLRDGGPAPFLVIEHLVRDQRTGSILFLGRVTDPSTGAVPAVGPVKQPVKERGLPPPG